MRAETRFLGQSKSFWAHVRSISEAQGYTVRAKRATKKNPVPTPSRIKTLDVDGIRLTFRKLRLSPSHLVDDDGQLSQLGQTLCDYFAYRADVLDNFVQPRLMNAEQAKALYEETKARLNPTLRVTMEHVRGQRRTLLEPGGFCLGLLRGQNPRQLKTSTDGRVHR